MPAVQAPHIPEPEPEPEPAYQPEHEPEPTAVGHFQPGPHDGLCCRALYDYQAGKRIFSVSFTTFTVKILNIGTASLLQTV